MSHEINQPFDIVYSDQGTDWHKLSTEIGEITKEKIKPILFKIEEERLPRFANHKALIAKLGDVRDDLDPEFAEIGLHVSKDGYQVIGNEMLFDMAIASTNGYGKVTRVGTLSTCSVFFVSVSLDGEEGFNVCGDNYLSNFNIISSHNGKIAIEAYDSMTRIVCMNTLQWSRSSKGELDFKVYHTRNAPAAIKNIEEVINQILSGRTEFKNQMEYLNSIKVSDGDARALVAAWLGEGKEELSTRSGNKVGGIMQLFKKGAGNKGETFYDLFNGVTEYFTSGDGTGSKSDAATKWAKAEFGKASEDKRDFLNFLMKDNHNADIKIGKSLLATLDA